MYEPSEREKRRAPPVDEQRYRRDRHTRLPWPVLLELLQRIGSVGRSVEAFKAIVGTRGNWLQAAPGGQVLPVT